MKIVYQDCEINDVMRFWMDSYNLKDGEVLPEYSEWFYDPGRGKVIFKLMVNETAPKSS